VWLKIGTSTGSFQHSNLWILLKLEVLPGYRLWASHEGLCSMEFDSNSRQGDGGCSRLNNNNDDDEQEG
jgi:hypothetical protein